MDDQDDRSARFLRHLEPLQGALEAYCRRSVQNSSDIEDVIQNTVAKAFHDFHLFAEGTNFRAWIFRYLNLTILEQNRGSTRATREEPLTDVYRAAGTGLVADSSIGDLLDAVEPLLDDCDEAIAAAVSDLGEREQSMLLLRSIGELKYAEIAEVLDVPVGTVMSSLSRARERLRTQLEEHCRRQGLLRRNTPPPSGATYDGLDRGGR